jgi:hypothetical protein
MVNPQLSTIMLAEIGGLLLLPVALLAFAFWIWMIVDCAKHETEGSTKITWLLIILFVGVVGAPLYFFIRRVPRRSAMEHKPASPIYQPWEKDQRIG